MRAHLPRPFDLATASLWATLWVGLLRPGFPEGRFLLALYLAAYFVFWLLLGLASRAAVRYLDRRSGYRPGLEAAASLGSQLTVALFVVLASRPDARPVLSLLVAAAGGVGAALVLGRHLSEARATRFGGTAAIVAPLLLLLLGPARDRDLEFAEPRDTLVASPSLAVRFLALDGIDPRVLRRALELGELPAFREVVENGVSASLQTISPHSPVIWTSIATGEPPARHGVTDYSSLFLPGSSRLAPEHPLDFLIRRPAEALGLTVRRSVSSNERRAFALWDLLSRTGRSSLVVNWWASYPVDAIHGVMISNMAFPWSSLAEPEIARLEGQPHLVHPRELQGEVLEAVRRYQRTRGEGMDERFFRIEGNEFFSARDDVAFELYERFYDPAHALSSVYLHGIDVASHYFTDLVFGPNVNQARPPRLESKEAAELWQELVAGAYRRMDRRVARALERLEPGSALVIVSDHGWDYDGTSHWNLPDGVFLAYGEGFASGVELDRLHLFDVFPTLAHALGIPISRELPGRVVHEAFDRDFDARNPGVEIAGYGERRSRIAISELPAEQDAAHLERLRALGYLD